MSYESKETPKNGRKKQSHNKLRSQMLNVDLQMLTLFSFFFILLFIWFQLFYLFLLYIHIYNLKFIYISLIYNLYILILYNLFILKIYIYFFEFGSLRSQTQTNPNFGLHSPLIHHYRQIDRQIDRQTDRQIDRYTCDIHTTLQVKV